MTDNPSFGDRMIAAIIDHFDGRDPYDGIGDTPNNPDIWVDDFAKGQVIAVGDNQPVDITTHDNTIQMNFDTEPKADSDVVIIDISN